MDALALVLQGDHTADGLALEPITFSNSWRRAHNDMRPSELACSSIHIFLPFCCTLS
jgi:hypothetical protein